jgi:hypothetical protein
MLAKIGMGAQWAGGWYRLSINITSATNTPPGGWTVFTNFVLGGGFDVSGGKVEGCRH